MTVLPLPGFVEPTPRPALARPARTVEVAGNVDALVAELRIAARAAADTGRAKSTERAYNNDWRDFCAFARLIGRVPHPAEADTVALYATDLARRGRAPATIARRLVSIAVYHRAAGFPSPTEHGVVRAVVSGLRRQLGVAQQQKTALEIDPLRTVLARIPGDVRGLRDRAPLLIGWAAALRRSELAALVVSDLRFEPDGLIIELRRSKTDQEAAGEVVAVPFGAQAETCPVRCARGSPLLVTMARSSAVSTDTATSARTLPRRQSHRSSARERRPPGSPVISLVIHCALVLRPLQRMLVEARRRSCGMVAGKALRLRVNILGLARIGTTIRSRT